VIEYREKNNVTRPDYLQHLITLKKKGETASDRGLDDSYEKKGLPPEQSSTYRQTGLLLARPFFEAWIPQLKFLAVSFSIYG
jgi:hypothetical protein